eukprot:m.168659 g.168659  ORF g.168659 m.168659 type:complete len:1141 (-) comp12987_c0_seq1:1756-5178(-)
MSNAPHSDLGAYAHTPLRAQNNDSGVAETPEIAALRRKQGKARSFDPVSDDDSASDVSGPGDTGATYISRKHVRTDGTKRRRLKRVLSDSSGDDEPQQKDNGHADERRQSGLAYEWVKKLTQMFPAFRASQVAMICESAANEDHAVELLLETDPEALDVSPGSGRGVRDDDEVSGPASGPNSPTPGDSAGIDVGDNDTTVIFKTLRNVFPETSESRLMDIAMSVDSVEDAMQLMLELEGEDGGTSHGANGGPARPLKHRSQPHHNTGWISTKAHRGKDTKHQSKGKGKRRAIALSSDEENEGEFLTDGADEEEESESESEGEAVEDDALDEDDDDSSGPGDNDDETYGWSSGARGSVSATAVEWFNESTVETLTQLPRCSERAAKKIVGLRPFSDYDDLLHKMDTTTSLTSRLVEAYCDMFKQRRAVEKVLSKCIELSDTLAKEAEIAKSRGAGALRQPSCLARGCQLKPFQLLGMHWLMLLYKHKVGSILADEMGLGKTCQAISFLAQLYATSGPRRKLFCVVVPSSVLANWTREFAKWCPEMNVCVLQGSVEERHALGRRVLKWEKYRIDVLLVTYNIVCSKYDASLFKQLPFDCAVFDEGHMLKNMKSDRYNKLMKINASRRVLLTGTPLQNNLLELLSLLNFVMPKVFRGASDHLLGFFKQASVQSGVLDSNVRDSMIAKARRIMDPFMLRRKKDVVLTDLPEKTRIVSKCTLTSDQRVAYDALLDVLKRAPLDSDEDAGDDAGAAAASSSDSGSKSKKAIKADKARAAVATAATNNDVLDTGAEGETTGRRRRTRSTADDRGANGAVSAAAPATPAPTATPDVVVAEEGHVQNTETLANVLVQARKMANHPLLHRRLYSNEKLKEMAKRIMAEDEYEDANVTYIEEDMSVMTDFELDRLCRQFPCSLEDFQIDIETEIHNSGKFRYLRTLLRELFAKDSRVLIFSQFQMMLDVLETFLKFESIPFLRIDGSTPVTERQDLIDKFTTDKSIPVFLLTTRAGGLGVNVTAADTVIIHDIDHNPQQDKQAEDRCHRVGQTKPVTVYRLIAEDTVEEIMLKMAEEKLQLDSDLSEEDVDLKSLAQYVRNEFKLQSMQGVEKKPPLTGSPRRRTSHPRTASVSPNKATATAPKREETRET